MVGIDPGASLSTLVLESEVTLPDLASVVSLVVVVTVVVKFPPPRWL